MVSRRTLRLWRLMRTYFDKFAKGIGEEALRPSGTTVAHDEITPQPQYADLRHEPDPAQQAVRDRLGLLGRLVDTVCLIECYSKAPGADAFRACLAKHFAFWQKLARKKPPDKQHSSDPEQPPDPFAAPFLWIIAAGAPTTLLTRLALAPAPGWPVGVYLFGAEILRVGIVVASELPRDRSTLLVRLMAAGPLLAQAAREVAALAPDDHVRVLVEPGLLELQHMLGQDPSPTSEEQEFIMVMQKTWEEGRAEARAEGQANAVLTVLRVRGIAVSDAVRERILAQKDQEQLKRWLEKSIVAASIADVITDVITDVIDDPR
jgi:hypothetical protein